MADPKKVAGGTLFHILSGESGFMYEIDRRMALAHHADEWKEKPWTAREVEAYNKRRKQAKAEEAPAEA